MHYVAIALASICLILGGVIFHQRNELKVCEANYNALVENLEAQKQQIEEYKNKRIEIQKEIVYKYKTIEKADTKSCVSTLSAVNDALDAFYLK